MDRIKIIGIEEHGWSPGIRDTLLSLPIEILGALPDKIITRLSDFGQQRADDVEAMGLDMQVLSITTPATQVLGPAAAVRLSREANDMLADVVRRSPERYAAMATLPMSDPQAAVDELERSVTELGLKGAMIHGRTGDKFIDHPDFAPVLDKAAALDVPVFIHPQVPSPQIADYYYNPGLPKEIGWIFAAAAWGWHMEAGINAIRLVISKAFDRTPGLKVILGHWGEMVPFYLERLDEMFRSVDMTGTSFATTFKKHFYVAPSGLWSYPMLHHAIAVMGVDKIVFATDYPFIDSHGHSARNFPEEADISYEDKQKIGHVNIEQLLRINGR